MNTKHLLFAATAAFVALNFTSCKEDKEMSIEEKIQQLTKVGRTYYLEENYGNGVVDNKISENDTINVRLVKNYLSVFNSVSNHNYDGELHFDLYLGVSQDNMKLVSAKNFRVETFNLYRAKIIEYITDGAIRYDLDSMSFMIYCNPDVYAYGVKVEWGNGGDGEPANWLKLKPLYTNNADDKIFINMPFSTEIKLYSQKDGKTYEKTIEYPFNTDSIYIVADNELPSYSNLLDISHLIKCYSSNYFGGNEVDSTFRIKTDVKQLAAIDYKISIPYFKFLSNNDTIVISSDFYKNVSGMSYLFDKTNYTYCSFSEFNRNIVIGNNIYLNYDKLSGYHQMTDDDWLDIESSFGIERQELNTYFIFKYGTEDIIRMMVSHHQNYEHEHILKVDSVCNFIQGKETPIANEITSKFRSAYAYSTGDTENVSYLYISNTTTTVDGIDYVACRLFLPYSSGVLRCLIPRSGQDFGIYKSYYGTVSTEYFNYIIAKDK